MTTDCEALKNLVAAAEALLDAREDQMVTAVEWDNLRKATRAARATYRKSITLQIHAVECRTASDAIALAEARGGHAILLNGKDLVASQAEIDVLAEAGVEFAYLHDHVMPDGTHRIVTVPVND